MSATLLVPDKFNSTGIIRTSEYKTILNDTMRKATLSLTLPIKDDQSANLTITVSKSTRDEILQHHYSYVWCRIENGRAIVDDDKYVGDTARSLMRDIFQVKSRQVIPENVEFSGPFTSKVTTMKRHGKYSKRVLVDTTNDALREWAENAIQSSLDDIYVAFAENSHRAAKSSRKVSAEERDEIADRAAAEIAAGSDGSYGSDTSIEY